MCKVILLLTVALDLGCILLLSIPVALLINRFLLEETLLRVDTSLFILNHQIHQAMTILFLFPIVRPLITTIISSV